MEKKNYSRTFMRLLVGLEAVEFVGLCRFLGVPLTQEKVGAEDKVHVEVEVEAREANQKAEPRDFTDLFSDLLENFGKLSTQRKKELIKILKKINK